MTIKELIKKLEQENQKWMNQGREPNGSYGVPESWYSDITKMDPRIDETDKFQRYYDNITGMIWGLKAAFFITDKEGIQLLEELNQIMEKFYEIEEE